MTPARFKTGDVVTLNSGGVRMTVHDTHPSGDVVLVWSDGKALHDVVLHEAMLSAPPRHDDKEPF